MQTSGVFTNGEPNFPPIAPMLLKVIVPPAKSLGLSLFANANLLSRESSFVIYRIKNKFLYKGRQNLSNKSLIDINWCWAANSMN